jgi:hypothetical protein
VIKHNQSEPSIKRASYMLQIYLASCVPAVGTIIINST